MSIRKNFSSIKYIGLFAIDIVVAAFVSLIYEAIICCVPSSEDSVDGLASALWLGFIIFLYSLLRGVATTICLRKVWLPNCIYLASVILVYLYFSEFNILGFLKPHISTIFLVMFPLVCSLLPSFCISFVFRYKQL